MNTFQFRQHLSVAKTGLLVALVLLWLAMVVIGLGGYLRCNPHLTLGLLALPMVILGVHGQPGSSRWVWAALGALAFFFADGPTVTLHLAAGFLGLALIEAFWGQVSVYAAGVWFMLSPVPDAVVGPFTFDLRLKISQLVGDAFRFLGAEVKVFGTEFEVGGKLFSVEAACLGLSSVNTGLILLLALLAAHAGRIRLRHQALIWATVLPLLLISNLFRIALVVLFQAPPETAAHELIGLLALVLYVVMPLGWLVRRFAAPKFNQPFSIAIPSKNLFIALTITFFAVGIGLHHRFQRPEHVANPIPPIVAPSFTLTHLPDSTLKLANSEALIYLKPGVAAWRSEHSPTVCWRGSGYEIGQQAQTTLPGGLRVNTGWLQKEGDSSLYTLWWFANGRSATASAVEWRKRTLRGEPAFWLVNVTAQTPEMAKKMAWQLCIQNSVLFENK